MGAISIERLLPQHFFRPDDASPIGAVHFPTEASIMRIGFDRKPGKPLLFEGETPVGIRLTQRTWHYKLRERKPGKDGKECQVIKTYETDRWRLEILMDLNQAGPLRPRHAAVIVQTPYSNGWVQSTVFKMYSKKNKEVEAGLPVFEDVSQVEKELEAAFLHDPWETGARYVAGISFPRGYLGLLSGKRPNKVTDYILGACPDFKTIQDELFLCTEIQRLMKKTECEAIAFWKRGAPNRRPRLYENTKIAASNLMMLSIQQALAGPCESSEKWFGKEVWKMVEYRYCSHLNNCNRKEGRRKEDPLRDDCS